jgi:Ca2+-binding RTX toxin-like protein
MKLLGAYEYGLTLHDNNVAAGAKLTVDASDLLAGYGLTLDGFDETDGRLTVKGSSYQDYVVGGGTKDRIEGGDGADDLNGVGGKDVINGGAGQDIITPGAGADTIVFDSGADSTSLAFDRIGGFNADADRIDVSIAISNVVSDSGTVNEATFDADLASQANDWVGAKIFNVDGGDYIGKVFLLIDLNGSVSYEAGTDLVIDITGFSGTVDTSDFI